jgi:hypothetical protein
MPTHRAPGSAPADAQLFAGAALLDAEKLDCYRLAVAFQALTGRLLPKRSGISGLRELGAHKQIMEMSGLGHGIKVIAATLNMEGLTSSRVHLGDHRYLPNVAVNSWTESDVQACLDVLKRRTESYVGTEALFAFVRRVHTELSKRSGMSVDLDLYG